MCPSQSHSGGSDVEYPNIFQKNLWGVGGGGGLVDKGVIFKSRAIEQRSGSKLL